MSNFLQTMLVSVLLVTSAATNAVDMAKPTGTGELRITAISIGSEGTTIDFEGPVENYGTVFATHYLQSVDGDRSRGTVTGQAVQCSMMAAWWLHPTTAHSPEKGQKFKSTLLTQQTQES